MFDDKPMKVNRRRKKNNIWPVIALIVFAILLSLGIAGVWQIVASDAEKAGSHSGDDVSEVQSSSIASSAPESAAVSALESMPELPPARPVFEGAVPESQRETNDYFKDAVFVGDSITTGIELYGVMADTKVLAGTGINLDSIYTAQVVKQRDAPVSATVSEEEASDASSQGAEAAPPEETRITIMDGLKQNQYKKVYVMLGGNEVRDEDQETFIKRYDKVIEDVKALQPNALLYVQSILPVTANNNYKMDNERIDTFNTALMELCQRKEVYYLNVAECMKDENGQLPDEASPKDGMHFGPAYYNKWFEYLKTHTVSQEQKEQAT